MSYITSADLSDRMTAGRLASFIPGSDSATTIAAVISRAEGRVDAYLAVRYATPVPANGAVQEAALAFAEWEVYRRGSVAVPEKIRQAYEDAVAWLEKVAGGDLAIGGAAAVGADVGGGIATSAETARMDESSLAGF